MLARAGKTWRLALWCLTIALCAALLTACDTGGSPPTDTPVAGTPGAGTPTEAAVGTPAAGATATAAPATAGPTDTVGPTALPTLTNGAAPTAIRKGNPVAGLNWRLMGLPGQDVFAVAGTGQVDAPVFVGSTGVYRSTDQGVTWDQLSFDKRTQASEIEVAPSDPKIIYAGSGAGCAGGLPGAQFRSTDSGATWTQLPEAPSSIQVDPKDPNLLTAITCQNVVRSTDGGQTWTALPDAGIRAVGNRDGDTVRVAASDNSVIYATYLSEGGEGRIRVSSDGGKTWAGSDSDFPGLGDLLVDAKRPQRAWALTQSCASDTNCDGVLRTIDGGLTWQTSVTGLDAAHNTSAGSQGAYQLAGLTAQYNSTGDLVELYAGSFATDSLPGAGIFGSKDGGQVWTRFGGDLDGRSVHSLFVTQEKNADTGSTDAILYAGTDDGVHKIYLNAAQ